MSTSCVTQGAGPGLRFVVMASPLDDEDLVPIGPLKMWLDKQGRGGRARLSRDLGVTPQVITNWLTRKSVPASRLRAVCRVMGVTTESYLGGAASTASTAVSPTRAPRAEHLQVAVEEPPPHYYSINLDRLTLVIGAVELLLPGYSPNDRANLAALAYDYLSAKASSDREVLAAFLRQWAKSALAQPKVPDFRSPEVKGDL